MTTRTINRSSLPNLAKETGHKYAHGHAVVLAGGPGRGGAARLAARAALRIGAGLVTVACSQRALPENASQLNAVMVHPIDGPFGLEELLEDHRVTALCLGPALGLTKSTADLVKVALNKAVPTVLDADALTRFERAPEALFGMLHSGVVLTPHGGEFTRLFPDIAAKYAQSEQDLDQKAQATQDAANRAGCVVLLKGAQTCVAAPDGICAVHLATETRAAPWLATAGAGDVLAGFITGLMARGLSPHIAAETAVWIHVEAARMFGPGLIAEDLSEMIPAVFASLQG